MRRMLVLAGLLLLAGLALAEDDKLPLDPAAFLAVGDWSVLLETGRTGLVSASRITLTRAEGDDLVFTISEKGQKDEERKASRKRLATLGGVVGLIFGKDYAAHELSDVKVEDEKLAKGASAWSCKKVSATVGSGRRSADVVCWFSSDVKRGLGLVELATEERKGRTRFQLVGYGSKTTEWGLDFETAGRAEDDRLPIDPLGGARLGDWTAFVTSASHTASGAHGTGASMLTVKTIDERKAALRYDVPGSRPPRDGMDWPIERAWFATVTGLVGYFVYEANGWIATDVKTVDEKRSIGGIDFACKKTSCTLHGLDGGEGRATVWLSADVKRGLRLVRVEVATAERSVTAELGGFGFGDKTEWGKTAQELAASALTK